MKDGIAMDQKTASRPRTQLLAEKLMGRIRELPEGSRIPSVRALMREYGVSQLLVSQALLLLREQGYLNAREGRGGTSVTAAAANLPVLWVCGTDIYHGQIGSFWGHCFTEAEWAFGEHGITLDPVWLSNFRPADCAPYLGVRALDRYRGFFFVGCSDEHPLLNTVRKAGRPFVRLTFGVDKAHEVATDFDQIVTLAMAHFRSLGRRTVTVIHPGEEDETTNSWPDIEAIAKRKGLTVRKAPLGNPQYMREMLRFAYETTKRLIKAGALGDAVLITDDVAASGATRAILECCSQKTIGGIRIVVAAALQEIAALGVPVDYVAFDIREVVARSIEMLRAQWGQGEGPERYSVPSFMVLSKDAARVASEAAIGPVSANAARLAMEGVR